MKQYLHHQPKLKIPSYIALPVLIVFAVVLSTLFSALPRDKKQDASILERVDIVNVRDTSVTLFWRTTSPTRGFVEYEHQGETIRVNDDRDVEGSQTSRMNHIVTLHGFAPETRVAYRIGVDSKTIGQSADIPFEVVTTRKLTHARDIDPLVGVVAKQDGTPLSEAFVIAHIPQARPLLTQSLQDGTFMLSLCCVVDQVQGEPLVLYEQSPIRYEIVAENGIIAQVQTDMSSDQTLYVDAVENQPGYVKNQKQELAQARPQNTESSEEVLAATDSSFEFQDIDIIYPREGSTIPGTRPLIKGFAEPGMDVKGTFSPENRIFQVTASEKRFWEYEPSFDFSPGQHELKIETTDSTGRKIMLTRTFVILKSGESVLGDATDSASVTPSPSPSPTATATPTLTTPTSTPPVTGVSMVPLSLLSLVLIVIGAGIVLLL